MSAEITVRIERWARAVLGMSKCEGLCAMSQNANKK